jgi:hypothetical protein
MCPILWHFVYPAYFFSSATPTYWADTLNFYDLILLLLKKFSRGKQPHSGKLSFE